MDNPRGNYSFLKGIGPYSAGAVAARGYEVVHARLAESLPLREGFRAVEEHLRTQGRPRQALCGMELRSPRPFTFRGFNEFNAGYIGVLKGWDLFLGDINPVARTNVAPEPQRVAEPQLYGFSYTMPGDAAGRTFVVAGAGELPEGSLEPRDVVKGPLAVKARFVLDLMDARLRGLGVSWSLVTTTNIYTVHDIGPVYAGEILPRLGPAARHGATWQHARPPIETIEYEMDLRGVRREIVIGA
jgi:hypothetical protein